MLKKTITIDGREVTFRASATVPRLYRMKFGRDIFSDIKNIQHAMSKNKDEESSDIPIALLTAFENTAYIMAKHADKNAVPEETVEEWLDSFNTFSIYEIFPTIAELWALNNATTETPKKK